MTDDIEERLHTLEALTVIQERTHKLSSRVHDLRSSIFGRPLDDVTDQMWLDVATEMEHVAKELSKCIEDACNLKSAPSGTYLFIEHMNDVMTEAALFASDLRHRYGQGVDLGDA